MDASCIFGAACGPTAAGQDEAQIDCGLADRAARARVNGAAATAKTAAAAAAAAAESAAAVVTAHLRDAQHAASVLKRKLEEEPGQNGAGLSEAKRRALSPVKQVLAYGSAGLAAAPAAQAAAAIEAAAEPAPQPQQAAKPQRLSDEADPK